MSGNLHYFIFNILIRSFQIRFSCIIFPLPRGVIFLVKLIFERLLSNTELKGLGEIHLFELATLPYKAK